LSTDYSLREGAMERFIKVHKPQNFLGKAASLPKNQRSSKKRFATLVIDEDCAADAPYMSTVLYDRKVGGETTSGAYGYRVTSLLRLRYGSLIWRLQGQRSS
jgi:dimethylglycine dehydrogenase